MALLLASAATMSSQVTIYWKKDPAGDRLTKEKHVRRYPAASEMRWSRRSVGLAATPVL